MVPVEFEPLFAFLATLIVGSMEREGWLPTSAHQSNVQMISSIFSWTATIIMGIIYYKLKKAKQQPVVSSGEVTVTPKQYPLQRLFDWIKANLTVQEKPPEVVVSTGGTQE